MAVCAVLALVSACDPAGPAGDLSSVPTPSTTRTPGTAPDLPARVAQATVRSILATSLRVLPAADGVQVVATYAAGASTKAPAINEGVGAAAWWCAGPPCPFAARPAPMPAGQPLSAEDDGTVRYALARSGDDPSVIDLARCVPGGCDQAGSVPATLAGRTLLAVAAVGADLLMLHTRSSPDGSPPEHRDVSLARCPIASCQAGWTSHQVAPMPGVRPTHFTLAVHVGRPVVAFHESPDRTTLLLCPDRACSSAPRAVTVTGMDPLPRPSVRVLPSGRIAVLSGRTLMTCDDPACATASVVALPQDHGWGATASAFTVDAAGRPLVVTTDASADLRLHTCADEACRESSSVLVGLRTPYSGSTLTVAVGAAGTPVVAWLARDTLTLVACETRDCR
ncbi:hypothetical protein Vau01_116200 [Virgisporangium aurantiacum]|uniref:Uncharacterized protein n=2 Tax=Virgisporangium aurantiacum TaxID=175570 RepID=A0A8J4E7B1_9ACTN|nr:hypothetical protein Vau01_116200 [Virgisporangium aurantiacum]